MMSRNVMTAAKETAGCPERLCSDMKFRRVVILIAALFVLLLIGFATWRLLKAEHFKVYWPKGSEAERVAVQKALQSVGLSDQTPHELLKMDRDVNVVVLRLFAELAVEDRGWEGPIQRGDAAHYRRLTDGFVERALVRNVEGQTILGYRRVRSEDSPGEIDGILEAALRAM